MSIDTIDNVILLIHIIQNTQKNIQKSNHYTKKYTNSNYTNSNYTNTQVSSTKSLIQSL